MKHRKSTAAVIAISLLASPPLLATSNGAEFEAMRAQLQAFSARLDALEQSNRQLREENERLKHSGAETAQAMAEVSANTEAAVQQFATTGDNSSWTDRISIKGDFRYRYENIDEAGKDARNRNRVRARTVIIADVTDDVQVGLGIASGSDDPVSTNQTLGGGGSTKDIRMDLAYFQWAGLDNTKIVGGKFKNILYQPGKHSLLWDGDWNPEGVGLSWAKGAFFANVIGTWIESDSRKDSETSYGVQAGFKKSIGDHAQLTAGVSYFDIGTAGKGSFYGDDDDFFGNSFDPDTLTYFHDYQELEVFADLAFEVGGRPANIFVDYVQNQDADEFDTGYAVGFNYGSADGNWQLGYTWEDLEADAVFGLLTDSDFGGGGTDARGHILKGRYVIEKNWTAGFTYFINEAGLDAGNKHDYDRLQVDLAFKY